MLHTKHIVHRDIKPDNLMFDKNGELKIIDFGTSKQILPFGKSNTLTGSPLFIAPEILNQNPEIDEKVDIWSVGIILYILCCFKYPYKENNPLSVQKAILMGTLADNMMPFVPIITPKIPYSPQLIEIYENMTKINPIDRYSCTQILSLDYFREFHGTYLTENPDNKNLSFQKQILSLMKLATHNCYIKEIIEKVKNINEDIIKMGCLEFCSFFELKITLINFLTISNFPEEAFKQISILEQNPSFDAFLLKDEIYSWIFHSRKVENSIRKDKKICLSDTIKKMKKFTKESEVCANFLKMICFEALAYYALSIENNGIESIDFLVKGLVLSEEVQHDSDTSLDISHLYNIAGIILSRLFSVHNGLEFFMKSLNLKNQLNLRPDHESFFGTYLQMGISYFNLQIYQTSLSFFEMAYKILYHFEKEFQDKYELKIEERILLCKLYINFSSNLFNCNSIPEDFYGNIKLLSNKLQAKNIDEFIAFEINLGVFYARNNQYNRALASFKSIKKLILGQFNTNCLLYEIVINNLKVLKIKYGSKNSSPLLSKAFMNIYQNMSEKDLENDYKLLFLMNSISIIMIYMYNNELPFKHLFRSHISWIVNCIKMNQQFYEKNALNNFKNIQQKIIVEKNIWCYLLIYNCVVWNKKFQKKLSIIPNFSNLLAQFQQNENDISYMNFKEELIVAKNNLIVCNLTDRTLKIEESRNLLERLSNQLGKGEFNYYYLISFYNFACYLYSDNTMNSNENPTLFKFLEDNQNLVLNHDLFQFLQVKIGKIIFKMNKIRNSMKISS